MTTPLQDADVRRRASRSEDNVAVTAGAGTGKTTLLIDTVLAKLLVGGRDIRRMLLLTFTEKAANEMRVRLGERLLALGHPATPEDKAKRAEWEAESPAFEERLKAAIEGIDRAEIGTIHSFCAHVLREHPIEAGLDPAFTVDEGSAFDAMFEREWTRWLERELGADAPRKEAWLRIFAKEVSLSDLEKTARELAAFKVPEEALDPVVARHQGEKALAAAMAAKAKEVEAVVAKCGEPANRLRVQLETLARHLRQPKGGDASFLEKNPSEEKKGWGTHFEEASRVASGGWKLAKAAAKVDGDLGAEALALLGDFARAFRRDYTSEGFVAFDGLLAHVRQLLLSREFPGIRERLKAKYDFILVDEFQDTDPAQCEILVLLAEEGRAKSAAEVVLRRGKLFIVGDPKQSIYSFRGADIVAYEEVKRRIVKASGREEVLRTNFRSHAGIIRTVNAVFTQLIRPAEGLQPVYEEILPREGREPRLPAQGLELTLFGSDRKVESDEYRRAEASWIAGRIRRDVGRVELPVDGQIKRLEYRHVAILFKALPDVHLYLDALRSEGVPYVVEGEKFFYGTSEVIDFVNLLRAASDPHDRIAVAGLLRSPLGGVDDRELVELKDKLDYRKARAGEPAVFATLRELLEAVGTRTVPAFIDLVFARTFALETAAASWHGEQAVANLLKVRQTAEALDVHGGLTLRQFLGRARESIREMAEEGESPLADETLDAVRIMSIHKAKGLEFPVVVLPDLHRQSAAPDDREPVRFDWPTYTLGLTLGDIPDAGGAALAHQEQLRRREETRRVLYVAMTRARESILLTGRGDYKSDSYLGLLSEAIPGLRDSAGPVDVGGATLNVAHESWEGGRTGGKAREKRKALKADWKKISARWQKREKDCAEILATPRFTSPSRLQEKRQVVATRDDLERMERGAAVGTLCHRVLESLDFAKPVLAGLVARHADDPAVAKEAEAVLAKFLKTPAFKAIAATKVLARELPFMMRNGDAILQGAIDLVVQEGKRVVVVDWKSDRGGAAEAKKEKYAEQRKWYLEAVKRILGAKKAAFRLVFLRTGETMEW